MSNYNKRYLLSVGSLVLTILIIILCIIMIHHQSKVNYDRCVNNGVAENICRELYE